MIPTEQTFADFLSSCGFRVASKESTPSAVVSVRRTSDGHSLVTSWLLDPRVTDELEEQCRREAKSIADGISISGETIIMFAPDIDGGPAVLQVGLGEVNR